MPRLSVLVLLVVSSLFVGNNEAVRVRSGSVRLGTNPYVAVRVRKSVLDSGLSVATELVGKHAKKIPLPDVACTVSGVDLEAKNLAISHFDEPKLAYKLTAPNRIVGTLELPKFGINGPYTATRRTLITTQHDAGVIDFVANNIKVNFDASVGECESGTPNIENFDCTAEMGQASVNVKNATQKFAIEVIGLGAKMVRPIVTTQVCATAKRIILDEINRYLAKIPNVLAFTKNFAVKYQVKPQFSDDYVQVGFFAKLLTDVVNPALPTPFNECPAPNAQIVLLMSDVVFNELAYHAHASGKLGYTVTQNIHPLVHGLLNTQCDCQKEACLGCALPHLAEKYGPDASVELTVKADKAPAVKFIQGKATFTASLHADLAITPAKPDSPTHHETASIEVTGSLQPRVVNNTLYARALVEDVKINIDNEPSKQYEQAVHNYCKETTEKIINDILFRGLPLKLPFGLDFTDPQVCVRDGTFQVHTGFKYEPKA